MKGNIVPPSKAYTDTDNVLTPPYYKALWHNCSKCKIHYMSESPHIRAYLCDECWNSMPHYKVDIKKMQKPDKGPTHDINLLGLLLYVLGCSLCILIIAYYLWVK